MCRLDVERNSCNKDEEFLDFKLNYSHGKYKANGKSNKQKDISISEYKIRASEYKSKGCVQIIKWC